MTYARFMVVSIRKLTVLSTWQSRQESNLFYRVHSPTPKVRMTISLTYDCEPLALDYFTRLSELSSVTSARLPKTRQVPDAGLIRLSGASVSRPITKPVKVSSARKERSQDRIRTCKLFALTKVSDRESKCVYQFRYLTIIKQLHK